MHGTLYPKCMLPPPATQKISGSTTNCWANHLHQLSYEMPRTKAHKKLTPCRPPCRAAARSSRRSWRPSRLSPLFGLRAGASADPARHFVPHPQRRHGPDAGTDQPADRGAVVRLHDAHPPQVLRPRLHAGSAPAGTVSSAPRGWTLARRPRCGRPRTTRGRSSAHSVGSSSATATPPDSLVRCEPKPGGLQSAGSAFPLRRPRSCT